MLSTLKLLPRVCSSQVDKQREDFKRLGVSGDWENPYVTLTPDYEAAQIRLGEMAKKVTSTVAPSRFTGHGHLSPALAEAEVNTMTCFQLPFTILTASKMAKVSIQIYRRRTTTPFTITAHLVCDGFRQILLGMYWYSQLANLVSLWLLQNC